MRQIAAFVVLLSFSLAPWAGSPAATAGQWDDPILRIMTIADRTMNHIAQDAVQEISEATTQQEVAFLEMKAVEDLADVASNASAELDEVVRNDPSRQGDATLAKKTLNALRLAYSSMVETAAEEWEPPPPTTTTTLPVTTTTVALPPPTTTTTTTTLPNSSTPTTTTTVPRSATTTTTSTSTTTTTTSVPPATTTTSTTTTTTPATPPPTTPPSTTSTTTTTTTSPVDQVAAVPPAQLPPGGATELVADRQFPADKGLDLATDVGGRPLTEVISRSLSVVLPPRLVEVVLSPFAVAETVLRALLSSGRELLIPVMLLAGALGWVGGGASKIGAALAQLLRLLKARMA